MLDQDFGWSAPTTVETIVVVRVKAEDIAAGLRNSFEYCPIAHALNRLYPEDSAYVGAGFAGTRRGKRVRLWAVLPFVAQAFIRNFDDGHNVRPFEFELAIQKGESRC